MALKKLLVAFTTVRDGKRTRFAAGKTVDLTDDEMEILESLTVKTGTLHFRSPVNEEADEGEVVKTRDYIGQGTAIDQKNVAQLKAMLDFHGVPYGEKDTKKALAELASKIDVDADDEDQDGEGGEGGDANDPDAGL